jgi:hypothetical protein
MQSPGALRPYRRGLKEDQAPAMKNKKNCGLLSHDNFFVSPRSGLSTTDFL